MASLANTTSLVLDKVLSQIKAGWSEKEVVALIKKEAVLLGLKKFAFQPLVASGNRSALPHARASEKKIKTGEVIFIDIGFKYNGICSDITRTFIIGKPSPKQKKIYKIVRAAQLAALQKVKAGVRCCDVDRAARDVIKKAGYGKYFIHTTGHGIGKKVHQAPKVGPKNKRRLKAGMVITVEPGIYIKGFGGTRIEDMILVTAKGYKLLTKVSYNFSIIRH